MKRLTLSMPCFGRPQRTIRAVECIANQTANDWEALVIGDGCPLMEDFIKSGYFNDLRAYCRSKGNDLYIANNPKNKGGHGYAITNTNIEEAEGRYFIFYANDDIILPNHFENYLSEIEGTDLDFVYFNSLVVPNNQIRNAQLQYGHIGHSELIVRTEFLRQMPKHNENYGHDWSLITNMELLGKSQKSNNLPTYHVMSLPDKIEKGID